MSCHNIHRKCSALIFFQGSINNLFNQHGELSSTLSLMGSNLISLTTVNLQTKETNITVWQRRWKQFLQVMVECSRTLKIHPLSASPGMYTGLSLTVSQGWCRISTPAATNHCLFRGQRPCFSNQFLFQANSLPVLINSSGECWVCN